MVVEFLERLRRRGGTVTSQGARRWQATCPAHDDRKPSLSILEGPDRILLKDHGGCTYQQIVAALGLTSADLFLGNGQPERRRLATPAPPSELAATTPDTEAPGKPAVYDYCDERGTLLFQVVRQPGKVFKQRRPNGRGGWLWNLAGVRRVVYRLPELAEAERIVHVEGEKDADRLVALGWRATTTPGGAGAWRDDYADQIKAAGIAEVVLLPDHDAPGERYAAQAVQSYARRELRVKIVRLPDLPEHGDVSDWLDAGHGADELAALIEATPWLESPPELPASEPTAAPSVRLEGEDGTFTWPAEALEIRLTGAREASEGTHAECFVRLRGVEVHWARLNLASTSAREALVRKLTVIAPEIPWREHLELACRQTAEHVRTGSPLVALVPAPRPAGQRDLIERVLPLAETSLIYADGDSGKGMVALTIALAVVTGHAFPHLSPTRSGVHVAYLDWETTEAEIAARVDGLCRGAGLTVPPGMILYRSMSRALADEAARLRADFARHQVGFVIVDSLVPACGADPEGADATQRTLNALRSFTGTTRLVISHVNRVDADKARGTTRPWGSVFVRNLTRATWEIKRADPEGDDLVLAAYLTKRNDGRGGIPPWGLQFRFAGDGAVTVHDASITHSPELLAKATVAQQLRAALANGSKTDLALSTELDLGLETVKRKLRAGKSTFDPLNDETPRLWGLRSVRVDP